MRKRSSILLSISIALLIVLGSTSFSLIRIVRTIEYDAKKINELGIIRGSLQRLVKLELINKPEDELIYLIDDGLKVIASEDKNELQHYSETLNTIIDLWQKLKEDIEIYRRDPSEDNQASIMETSELLWTHTNQAVYLAQRKNEIKIENFKVLLPFLLVNILLISIIALLIKRYVRDQLERTVNFDALTKIFNRHYFYQVLEKELYRADRYQKPMSFILLDVDNFKRVNDTFGHDVGDAVLIELCSLCQASIRKSDVLARIGGEEFVIIAPDTNQEEGMCLAQKVRGVIERHSFNTVGNITISLGLTMHSQGDTKDAIYKRADKALYKAKQMGKNRVEVINKGTD